VDIHWRNTQRPVRFFVLDARCSFAVLFVMVYLRIWTLALAFIVMFIFWLLERRGLSFDASLRALRRWILGTRRPANHRRRRRYWIDYG
jgi:intracellular multiplication protein IcmT